MNINDYIDKKVLPRRTGLHTRSLQWLPCLAEAYKSVGGRALCVRLHRLKFFILSVYVIFVFLFQSYCFGQVDSKVNPDVYFNSAIDKYIKGDYDGSIELLENVLSQNIQNQKAKEFLVKILVEATEKQIMLSNYTKAKKYLEKAKIISPEDTKINELVRLTSDKSADKPAEKEVLHGNQIIKETKKEKDIIKKVAVVKQNPKSEHIQQINRFDNFKVTKETADNEKEINNFRKYFIISIVFFVIIIIAFAVFYIRAIKKIKKFKKNANFYVEERNKLKQLAEVKKNEEKKRNDEIESMVIIQDLEKRLVTENESNIAQQKFDESIKEDKILDEITSIVEKDDYSKQIVQKMIISIKTIMNIDKTIALGKISNLSKNERPRLRCDSIKIIENILTKETFKILLDLINDRDYEVKKMAIIAVNNICKSFSSAQSDEKAEIPADMISMAKKILQQEKTRNGWII